MVVVDTCKCIVHRRGLNLFDRCKSMIRLVVQLIGLYTTVMFTACCFEAAHYFFGL